MILTGIGIIYSIIMLTNPFGIIEKSYNGVHIFSVGFFTSLFLGVGLFGLFSRGLRRVRLKVYENGLVPYAVPKSYKLEKQAGKSKILHMLKELCVVRPKTKKGEEYFKPWDDIIHMTFIDRRLIPPSDTPWKDFWIYTIVWKDYTATALCPKYFQTEKDADAVLKKLKEVHKKVKERGEVSADDLRGKIRPWYSPFADSGW